MMSISCWGMFEASPEAPCFDLIFDDVQIAKFREAWDKAWTTGNGPRLVILNENE